MVAMVCVGIVFVGAAPNIAATGMAPSVLLKRSWMGRLPVSALRPGQACEVQDLDRAAVATDGAC